MIQSLRSVCALLLLIIFIGSFSSFTHGQTLPSETPQELKPTNYGLEYERRDVMIPMRGRGQAVYGHHRAHGLATDFSPSSITSFGIS
jgi:hypothetical protein